MGSAGPLILPVVQPDRTPGRVRIGLWKYAVKRRFIRVMRWAVMIVRGLFRAFMTSIKIWNLQNDQMRFKLLLTSCQALLSSAEARVFHYGRGKKQQPL